MKLIDLQNEQFDNRSYENIADEIKHWLLQIKALKKEEVYVTNKLIAFTIKQRDKWNNNSRYEYNWNESPEFFEVENSKLNKHSIRIFNKREAAAKQLGRLIAYKKDPAYSLKYPQTTLGNYPRVI